MQPCVPGNGLSINPTKNHDLKGSAGNNLIQNCDIFP